MYCVNSILLLLAIIYCIDADSLKHLGGGNLRPNATIQDVVGIILFNARHNYMYVYICTSYSAAAKDGIFVANDLCGQVYLMSSQHRKFVRIILKHM